ncbi:hypothetical protein RJT34_02617 [Clitoria ternatea]|uniref:Transmembrane protein n=1 Tax=Clitoria ternatea TaxID=43366 RepID=A0AAN9PZ32_CLITE
MAPNFFDILSECRHLLKPHKRHFHTLCLIFLFPLSFTFISYLSFSITLQPLPLLYSRFVFLFSYCATISITYSTFHFLHAQPVNLLSAVTSIPTSIFPLFFTNIISQVPLFLISILYFILLPLITPISPFPYLIGLFALPLLLVILYLQVTWTLVPVLVVVESCWGVEPLRRSARLMKGMKRVALSSFLFFGFFTGSIMWNCLFVTRGYDGFSGSWGRVVCHWVVIVTHSYMVATLMLGNIVFNTVLYSYCKANHGEVVEEFGKDYVSLPVNVYVV